MPAAVRRSASLATSCSWPPASTPAQVSTGLQLGGDARDQRRSSSSRVWKRSTSTRAVSTGAAWHQRRAPPSRRPSPARSATVRSPGPERKLVLKVKTSAGSVGSPEVLRNSGDVCARSAAKNRRSTASDRRRQQWGDRRRTSTATSFVARQRCPDTRRGALPRARAEPRQLPDSPRRSGQ